MNNIGSSSHRSEKRIPLISVITVCLNAQEFIEQCIQSVLSQDFDDFEYVIIDGGSTDGTVDIIRRYQDKLVYWCSEPDQGIYHAWNKALSHAHGKWIYFLGADDYLWSPDVLEKISHHLRRGYPPYRIVYGQVALVNQRNEVLYYVGEPWCRVEKKFMQIMALPHQGVMHHVSLFDEYGVFDECFRIAGDYEFLLRELRDHDALFVPDVIMAGMQVGGISSDPSGSLNLLREIRQAHQKLLGGESGWYWRVAYLKVWIRKLLWGILGETMTRRLLDLARICVGKPRHWTRI